MAKVRGGPVVVDTSAKEILIVLISAAVIVGVFVLYVQWKTRRAIKGAGEAIQTLATATGKVLSPPLSIDTIIQKAEGAKATTSGGSTFLEFTPRNGGVQTGKSVTFKFQPGDEERLNFAQRTLIRLDPFIPGNVTRKVLGG